MTLTNLAYTHEDLTRMHLENFRAIAAQYPKGHCVGLSSWKLRITPHGASLITTYQIKNAETGEWSGNNEWQLAL